MNQHKHRLYYPLLVVIFMLTIFFISEIYRIIDQYIKFQTYRPISAEITDKNINKGFRFSGSHSITEYDYPEVKYQYDVDGVRYVNNKIWINEIPNRQSVLEDAIFEYRPGKTVTAYYDPQNPAHSFLARKYNVIYYNQAIMSIIGLSFFCVCFQECRYTLSENSKTIRNKQHILSLNNKAFIRRLLYADIILFLFGSIILGHYFYFTSNIDKYIIVTLIIYGITLFIPVILYLKYLYREHKIRITSQRQGTELSPDET